VEVSESDGINFFAQLKNETRHESFRDNHYSEKLYAKVFQPKIWINIPLLHFMWDNHKYSD